VLYGDVGAERMSDEDRLGCRQVLEQGFQVVGERTGPELLGKIRVPVPPEVERDHVVAFGEAASQVVPPVCVCPRAVEEDQLGSSTRAVVNAVEMNSVELRSGESLCAPLHPARSVSHDHPRFPIREIAFHCSGASSRRWRTDAELPNSPFPALLGAFFV
jgi:hypothetical protein